jgi:hypothetical protein
MKRLNNSTDYASQLTQKQSINCRARTTSPKERGTMGDSLFHSLHENTLVSSHIRFLYVTSHFPQPLSNPTLITPIITRRESILCQTIVFLAGWRCLDVPQRVRGGCATSFSAELKYLGLENLV